MKNRYFSIFPAVPLTFLAILLLSPTGCSGGIKDKPLPFSRENVEKYAKELNKASKSMAPSPSQDTAELLVSVHKKVLEKMGYSFDKTTRSALLFHQVESAMVMNPVIRYVLENPKRALDKGFISQRTFDVLDAIDKSPIQITKEGEEFLGFVTECQNKNNGVCNTQGLVSVLAVHNALPNVNAHGGDETSKAMILHRDLDNKYGYIAMSGLGKKNGLITKPDGTEINMNFIKWNDRSDDFKFIVNQKMVEITKRYTKMMAEERAALSN
jgi:hypothetical protein